MGQAMRLPADVAAAAHDPRAGLTLVRLEGFGPSVEARARLLIDALGAAHTVAGVEARELWARFAGGTEMDGTASLWRVSTPRRAGLDVARTVTAAGGRWIADWAGGLLWCTGDLDAAALRAAAQTAGGHVALLRAPEAMRKSVCALHPETPGKAVLSARVRLAFDPAGVFETGRFLDQTDAN